MTFEYFLASICHSYHFDVEITMKLKVAYMQHINLSKENLENNDTPPIKGF